MHVAFDASPRATLAVVSLGTPDRLPILLAELAGHKSRHGFSIIWVENAAGRWSADRAIAIPEGVLDLHPGTNLGWSAALHLARSATDAEFLVWVQDDMSVKDGWLDALIDAADEHPEFAAFGSRAVEADGSPADVAAGTVSDSLAVVDWNHTDTTRTDPPHNPTRYEWITSKGMLTRTAIWDLIGGADPRLFPLHHVDKDYCTHLRSHGYPVALVPGARLSHSGSLSAPSSFRYFLREWGDGSFDDRWRGPLLALDHMDRPVQHDCAPWRMSEDTAADAARAAQSAAAAMVIPLGKWFSAQLDASQRQLADALAAQQELRREAAAHQQETQRLLGTASWRITAPLRSIRARLPRVGRRRSDLG